MTFDASDQEPTGKEAATPSPTDPHPGTLVGRTARRIVGAHVGRVPVGGAIAAVAIAALLGSAYYIGTPAPSPSPVPIPVDGERAAFSAPVASPANGQNALQFGSVDSSGEAGSGTTTTTPVDQLTASLEAPQIVKTGSMAIEVTDLNKAVSQAQSTIVGLGGDVSESSLSGDKDVAVATVTYRVPAARWDDALAAMRGLASRVISAQTNSTDVTAQAIDLDARLSNLNATEAALQSIMARASAIPDVLAIEQQLSQTEGQIEELKAQQNHLKDQAAMSTLSVSFSTPAATVTTQAAKEWDLGAQVDEAAATLVHIAQGLVTIAVWVVVVGLPIAIGLALLGAIWWIVRRIGRGRRRAAAGA